jgi:hypothetical protein
MSGASKLFVNWTAVLLPAVRLRYAGTRTSELQCACLSSLPGRSDSIRVYRTCGSIGVAFKRVRQECLTVFHCNCIEWRQVGRIARAVIRSMRLFQWDI